MAQIIDLAAHRPSVPVSATEEEGRAYQRLRREAQHIDIAIAAVSTLSPDHAQVAAGHLTEILSDALRLGGVRKTDVAAKVPDWRKDGMPTKRLDKLTLPPREGRPAEVWQRLTAERAKRLQRRPSSFVRVAEAIASCMASRPYWSREEILVRLFRGTRIDTRLQQSLGGAAPADDCWQELSARMQEMAGWVAQEAPMRGLLDRMGTVIGNYDLAEDEIRLTDIGLLGAHGPLNASYEVPEEFPPVPSVLLFSRLLADVPNAILRLNRVGRLGPELDGDAEQRVVHAKVWREVRLAVGPADTATVPAALFEIRTRVDVSDTNGVIHLKYPWLDLPGGWVRTRQGDVERDGDLDLGEKTPDGQEWDDLLAWPEGGPVEGRYQPHHCYIIWRLVTPELCSELLGSSIYADGVHLNLHMPLRQGITWTPSYSVGAYVELALLAEDEPRLDRTLVAEARRLTAKVEAYVAKRRALAAAAHARASARWTADSEDIAEH